MSKLGLCCPVCNASFRGSLLCSRCGADLSKLMSIAVRQSKLRKDAAASLAEGNPEKALASARKAQYLMRNQAGKKIMRLAQLFQRYFITE